MSWNNGSFEHPPRTRAGSVDIHAPLIPRIPPPRRKTGVDSQPPTPKVAVESPRHPSTPTTFAIGRLIEQASRESVMDALPSMPGFRAYNEPAAVLTYTRSKKTVGTFLYSAGVGRSQGLGAEAVDGALRQLPGLEATAFEDLEVPLLGFRTHSQATTSRLKLVIGDVECPEYSSGWQILSEGKLVSDSAGVYLDRTPFHRMDQQVEAGQKPTIEINLGVFETTVPDEFATDGLIRTPSQPDIATLGVVKALDTTWLRK